MKKTFYFVPLLLLVLLLTGCGNSAVAPQATTPTPTTPPPVMTPPATIPTTVSVPPVTEPTAPAAINSVTIQNFSFSPDTITIKAGGTVTWNNLDTAPHKLISENLFDSAALTTGASFSYTFAEAGTYDYHCSIHPSMTGKVIVE